MAFHEAIKKALQHLELAERFLAEGRELIDKDPVQASEKLYKAAEEAVKALAIALNLDEAEKALEKGRWTVSLLNDAIYAISEKLRVKELMDWWDAACRLHVDGFHEARLRSVDVTLRLSAVIMSPFTDRAVAVKALVDTGATLTVVPRSYLL